MDVGSTALTNNTFLDRVEVQHLALVETLGEVF
jgi:hypothetical protein